MRILVVSDSHGSGRKLKKAILAQPTADIVIHLGDGEEEVGYARASFPEKMFLQVRGNCDWGSTLPLTGEYTVSLEGQDPVKIFYAHGHTLNVKSELYTAVCTARERKARVLLYGHTHQPYTDYEDGLYIMNPGSLKGWKPTYGTLDITPQGIVTNIVKLR